MPEGTVLKWLEPNEIEGLAIKFGTLTAAERKIMEEHVLITKRLLDKIQFSKQYRNVPIYAASHHEKLSGKGYPYGKTEKDLPIETRILTVMDVFEALTAKDRPYKKPLSLEKAFEILDKMVESHEVDPKLVALLKQWKPL
jgi:HD-GYP domain-containing protein (c-di-GMP phosphodiesterase class II)